MQGRPVDPGNVRHLLVSPRHGRGRRLADSARPPAGSRHVRVSAALGVAGLILAGFEMVMPIVGFLGGVLVGQALGSFADYVATAVLVGAGAMMLRGEDAEGGE